MILTTMPTCYPTTIAKLNVSTGYRDKCIETTKETPVVEKEEESRKRERSDGSESYTG